jgi:hypothetical protein
MGHIDDLKKLSPKERLSKLKELEKKNKDEIELARKLMSESEREIQIEEEMKEIPIPEIKAVDIDELFSPDAKQIFMAKRLESPKGQARQELKEEEKESKEDALERLVAKGAKEYPAEVKSVQYDAAIDEAQHMTYMASKLADAYDTIKDLTSREYLTGTEQKRLESYSDMAREVYSQKAEAPSDLDKARMLAAEKLLYEARLK